MATVPAAAAAAAGCGSRRCCPGLPASRCIPPLSSPPLPSICPSLLPVNYTSYVAPAGSDGSDSYDDEFLRMTMSAVPSGSKLLW